MARGDITLGDIVGSTNVGGTEIDLINEKEKKYGILSIQSTIASPPSENVFMKWHAQGLRNVEEEEFDKSDPYLTFYKK